MLYMEVYPNKVNPDKVKLSNPDELMVASLGFALLAGGQTDTPDGAYLHDRSSQLLQAYEQSGVSDNEFNGAPTLPTGGESENPSIVNEVPVHEFRVLRGAFQAVIDHKMQRPHVKDAVRHPLQALNSYRLHHSYRKTARQLIEQLPIKTHS